MKKFLMFAALLPLALSCSKELDFSIDDIETQPSFNSNQVHNTGEDLFPYAVIGEKHPNPLEIENMKQAFRSLTDKCKMGFSEKDILPTHKYIAFTPSNEKELIALDALKEEEVCLSSYPLDYDVSDGIIVPDDRFRTNGYAYRWAYVPYSFDLSKVECPYTYYYDIFSPDETSNSKSKLCLPNELLDSLEVKSYALCGIQLTPVLPTKASSVHPSGRIRFFDSDSSKFRGVNGLSIRSVRGTHSSYTHCNAEGDFRSSDTFKYDFRYEIHFSRTDFLIRKNGSTDEIILKYSDYHGPINKDFTNEEKVYYAVVSRAAIAYYYGNACDMRRPPKDSDNSARLAIQAHLGNDDDVYGYFCINKRFILSDRPILHIYRKSNDVIRPNIGIYSTTIHELAHASHWRNNSDIFNQTDNQIKESFARGVQWLLTNVEYSSYTPDYWRQSYTGIIQDLIDGYGTKSSNFFSTWIDDELQFTFSPKSYLDNVTGYTPKQIELALRKSKTWNAFQYNLLNDNPGIASNTDVADAFAYWNSSY